jgi:hypothetical protein
MTNGRICDMASYGIVFLSSFTKIGAGVQAILRHFLNNLNGCNIGVTVGNEL